MYEGSKISRTSRDGSGSGGYERANKVVTDPASCSDTMYESELEVDGYEHNNEIDEVVCGLKVSGTDRP